MSYYGFRRYVPVAARRRRALKEVEARRKSGDPCRPIVIEGRKITRTFWGDAWCENLERYSDYENRLPRGRTYVRNGSVVDLAIAPGEVRAVVSGSELYDVTIAIDALPAKTWKALCTDCSGAIDSVVELLAGRFARGVMERICRPQVGLFPAPKEIRLRCSCPDWASMCKHVAAVLYGVGARLDSEPDLLFRLRKVDHAELVAGAAENLARGTPAVDSERVLAGEDLGELFGVEFAPPSAETNHAAAAAAAPPPRKRPAKKPPTKKKTAAKKKTGPTRKPVPGGSPSKRGTTAKKKTTARKPSRPR